MSNDLANKTSDRERMSHDDYELRYWSEKWGVSEVQIKRAIAKVGPMVKDVARELGNA